MIYGKEKTLLYILSNYLLPLTLPYEFQKILNSVCIGHTTSIFDQTIALCLLM